MILTAHQPVYLPWLGLFHKIALADKFIFFDQVQYVSKDYISRNQIKTSAGPLLLTVPVLSKDHMDKKISEVEINNQTPWQRKHWKSIVGAYAKAPYFKQHADFFEDTYQRPWRLLADLNYHMLLWLLDTLGIKVPVEKMSAYQFTGAKSDLVLDMCVQLGAKTYIFGAQGSDYADTESFRKAGVSVMFQEYRHPVYRQLHGNFVPYMSAIDLLFNEGPNSLEILMSGNATKGMR